MRAGAHLVIVGAEASSLLNFRRTLITEAISNGLSVSTVSNAPNEMQARTLLELGVKVHVVPFSRGGMSGLTDLRTFFTLLQLFLRVRPDAVFSYTAKPVIYGLLAAYIVRTPIRAAMITGLGYAFVGGGELKRIFARFVVKNLYRVALATASTVLFQNRDDQLSFRDLGILKTNVHSDIVNGSGVDVDYFSVCSLPLMPVFVMISRLLIDKGVREYTGAASMLKSRFPEVRVLLVGDLDDTPNSMDSIGVEWMASNGVECLGHLDDVRSAIAGASVVVLPSYREGTPRSVLEGMAMGRAIIATDVPGCRETVTHGVNGLLVPPRDAAALANAMIELARDRELVARMGRESRRIVEEKYEARKVAVDTLQKAKLI